MALFKWQNVISVLDAAFFRWKITPLRWKITLVTV